MPPIYDTYVDDVKPMRPGSSWDIKSNITFLARNSWKRQFKASMIWRASIIISREGICHDAIGCELYGVPLHSLHTSYRMYNLRCLYIWNGCCHVRTEGQNTPEILNIHTTHPLLYERTLHTANVDRDDSLDDWFIMMCIFFCGDWILTGYCEFDENPDIKMVQ